MNSEPLQPSNIGKWYTKKRFVVPLGLAAVLFISQLGGGSEPTKTLVPASGQVQGIQTQETSTLPKVDLIPEQKQVTPTQEATPAPKTNPTPQVQKTEPAPVTPKTTPSSGLSNDNYYTNVNGNKVHSPAYSDTIPAGASAKCKDGTYSFSQNRRGTCSGHGGVAVWY